MRGAEHQLKSRGVPRVKWHSRTLSGHLCGAKRNCNPKGTAARNRGAAFCWRPESGSRIGEPRHLYRQSPQHQPKPSRSKGRASQEPGPYPAPRAKNPPPHQKQLQIITLCCRTIELKSKRTQKGPASRRQIPPDHCHSSTGFAYIPAHLSGPALLKKRAEHPHPLPLFAPPS